MIDTGGAVLRARVVGDGPLVVMVHGFPESWYSWRHQIAPVAAAGFKVAAIDVRGYGGSQRFSGVADYDMAAMVGDLIGVGAALAPGQPFILIGHDWGAPMVWNTALIHPGKIAAVAALSVPHFGVPAISFDLVIQRVFDDRDKFFYQSYFREPGRAEAALEADPRRFLRGFYYAISGDADPNAWPMDKPAAFELMDGLHPPDRMPDWMGAADMDYYTGEFATSGFFGPLSRYRNHTRDWKFLQAVHGRTIDQPALFIAGDKDPAFTGFGMVADPIARMRLAVPGLEGAHVLAGCGHWTQQERPGAVNTHLTA
jgi:pimeloyl-ACP methyl ester carboxylesterase